MAIGIGRHLVKVIGHVLGRSSTGTPHIAVLFENVSSGDRITWYGYLSDKALERTITSLEVLGWDAAAHGGQIDRLHGTDVLVGHEAEIVVEMEVYEGKANPKVKWVNAVGGGLGDGMPADEAVTFGASMRQKILSAAASKPKANPKPGPARAPAAVAAGTVDQDDDLPF
jgi:hypothetical protein